MLRVLLISLAVWLLVAGPAQGGGPLVVDVNGTPVGWETQTPVPYHTDQGGLGLLSQH